MRLLIFIAVIVGVAVIFGAVYGISALVERKRSGRGGSGNRGRTVTKTTAPDDDPEFLRNLARRLAEEEKKKNDPNNKNEEPGETPNDK